MFKIIYIEEEIYLQWMIGLRIVHLVSTACYQRLLVDNMENVILMMGNATVPQDGAVLIV